MIIDPIYADDLKTPPQRQLLALQVVSRRPPAVVGDEL